MHRHRHQIKCSSHRNSKFQTETLPTASTFVAVQVESAPPAPAPVAPTLDLQVRLPNGATLDVRGADLDGVITLLDGLGRLRCSASTKP